MRTYKLFVQACAIALFAQTLGHSAGFAGDECRPRRTANCVVSKKKPAKASRKAALRFPNVIGGEDGVSEKALVRLFKALERRGHVDSKRKGKFLDFRGLKNPATGQATPGILSISNTARTAGKRLRFQWSFFSPDIDTLVTLTKTGDIKNLLLIGYEENGDAHIQRITNKQLLADSDLKVSVKMMAVNTITAALKRLRLSVR